MRGTVNNYFSSSKEHRTGGEASWVCGTDDLAEKLTGEKGPKGEI